MLVTTGSELAVPDDQVAVLLHGGRALASFGPGRHVLAADNVPPMEGWAEGIEAEVYFVNTRKGVPIKWGGQVPYRTPTAPAQPEKALGHGILTVHVADPRQFIVHLVGNLGVREHEDVWGLVREMIARAMVPMLSELTWPLTDHPLFHELVAKQLRPRLEAPLADMGAVCQSLTIQSLQRAEPAQQVPHDPGYPLPQQVSLSSMLNREPGPAPGLNPFAARATQPPSAPITPGDIMNLGQAAAYLQIPEAEVLQLIEAGQIKARKLGAEYRMIRQKLDEWLGQRGGQDG